MANLDMKATGERIKELMKFNGLSVTDLQQILGFSCPQSIYKWFRGESYPTINHIYDLSILFDVPIEDLLRTESEEVEVDGEVLERKNIEEQVLENPTRFLSFLERRVPDIQVALNTFSRSLDVIIGEAVGKYCAAERATYDIKNVASYKNTNKLISQLLDQTISEYVKVKKLDL